MEIITEIFEAIDSQYLLVLAVVLVFLFTKEGFFSKIGREATVKIVYSIIYGLFILAVLPALKEMTISENLVYIIFFAITLGMVVHVVKYFLSDKVALLKPNSLSNAGNLLSNQTSDKINFSKDGEFPSFSAKKEEAQEQQYDILDEISELLLYKKAITEDRAEVWFELVRSTENKLGVGCKIKIFQLALQSKSIKNNPFIHVKMLSSLGDSYFDNNEFLKAVDIFEKSLAINTIDINPNCLIKNCISLGKSYALSNKSQESDAMYDKARAYYINANNLNIELNQETINIINGVFSNSPSPASQPS